LLILLTSLSNNPTTADAFARSPKGLRLTTLDEYGIVLHPSQVQKFELFRFKVKLILVKQFFPFLDFFNAKTLQVDSLSNEMRVSETGSYQIKLVLFILP
jgi:hypothetical protein